MEQVKLYEKVFAKMIEKYNLPTDTPVLDLTFYLNDEDWKKLSQAIVIRWIFSERWRK